MPAGFKPISFFNVFCGGFSFVHFLRVALLAVLLLCSGRNICHAAAPTLSDSELQRLAQSLIWQRLGHYYPVGWGRSNWRSQVDDKAFFLSPQGAVDAYAELRATLNAFYDSSENLNQHAVCRFPARWLWLSRQLALPAPPITPEQCPELKEWQGFIKPYSLTLVFASSYLNSPSSMFGHTFLRIDPANLKQSSDWLSQAVNFGAEYRPDDNSLIYAYRGIFGGYPGFFSVLSYQEKINEYNNIENRDLWEYQLNLSDDEVRMLAAHLWELKNIKFDYFFFDENCSYRLLELLEIARPSVELTDRFSWRAIPLDTVRVVQQAGMVSEVSYRPSKATELQFNVDLLNAEQQKLALDLAEANATIDAIQAYDKSTQARILLLAYQQVRANQRKQTRKAEYAARSLALLQALHALGAADQASVPRPAQPDSGHMTFLTALGLGRSNGSQMADLRVRASYHDLADAPQGYLDGAAINLGDMHLRAREHEGWQLEALHLIDIRSHSPRNQFVSPLTWRINTGLERVFSEDDSALAAQVHGGAGMTYRVGDRSLCYGLAMARSEHNPLLRDNLAAGLGGLAGCVFYAGGGTLVGEWEAYQFSDGRLRADSSLIFNLPFAPDHALRFEMHHIQQLETAFDELMLQYRFYY